ncbi:MAG: ATP-binding cassette domain-containing protein [Planctomycetes bacterium]|nr:ATP-binding cassette domain-containing protein [Planctomycetota bacterium]
MIEIEGNIRTVGLACGYGDEPILSDVDLVLPSGKVSCILGKSGCGKSTLLRTLLLLERPLAGDIRFGDLSVKELDADLLDQLRRRTGVLFQGSALFNSMTLLENAAFPLIERSGLPRSLARELALLKLDLVGLSRFAHFLPAAVSGGMRKRCGIARALALDPPYLFLDEPSAGLDPFTSAEIDGLLNEICDALATTIVVVTHELRSVERIADHLVMLADRGVAAQGPPDEVRGSGNPAVSAYFSPQRAATPLIDPHDGLASFLLPDEN